MMYENIELRNLRDIEENGFTLINETVSPTSHKLIQLLSEHELNFSDLGRLTGFPRQSINMIMYGKTKPPLELALKVAHIFNTPVEEIFKLDESAWVQPLKHGDETSIYYDAINDEVISSQEKIQRIKDTRIEYYNKHDKSITYSRTEGLCIINRKDFDGDVAPIYQKIGIKTEPYVIGVNNEKK